LQTTDLSPKELETVRWAYLGWESQDIAHFMGVQKNTIQNRLGKVYDKLLFPPNKNRRVMVAVWYANRLAIEARDEMIQALR
jgi:DNA-binding NarL/FixJ family response regulator